MKRLVRILDGAEAACLAGSAFTAAAIMLLTVADVILRKFTSHSIPSLYEMTQDYFMVALVFLSISHVYRIGGHVRVTLFQGIIPRPLRTPVNKGLEVLMLVFFVLLTWAGWSAAAEAWEYREVSSSLLAYPLAPALMMVPLGAGLAACRVIQNLFRPAPDMEKE